MIVSANTGFFFAVSVLGIATSTSDWFYRCTATVITVSGAGVQLAMGYDNLCPSKVFQRLAPIAGCTGLLVAQLLCAYSVRNDESQEIACAHRLHQLVVRHHRKYNG